MFLNFKCQYIEQMNFNVKDKKQEEINTKNKLWR